MVHPLKHGDALILGPPPISIALELFPIPLMMVHPVNIGAAAFAISTVDALPVSLTPPTMLHPVRIGDAES